MSRGPIADQFFSTVHGLNFDICVISIRDLDTFIIHKLLLQVFTRNNDSEIIGNNGDSYCTSREKNLELIKQPRRN